MSTNKLYQITNHVHRCTVTLDDEETGLHGIYYVWVHLNHGIVMSMRIEGEGWDDYTVPDFHPEYAYVTQVAVQKLIDEGYEIVDAKSVDRDYFLEITDSFMAVVLDAMDDGVSDGTIQLMEMKWHQPTLPQ